MSESSSSSTAVIVTAVIVVTAVLVLLVAAGFLFFLRAAPAPQIVAPLPAPVAVTGPVDGLLVSPAELTPVGWAELAPGDWLLSRDGGLRVEARDSLEVVLVRRFDVDAPAGIDGLVVIPCAAETLRLARADALAATFQRGPAARLEGFTGTAGGGPSRVAEPVRDLPAEEP